VLHITNAAGYRVNIYCLRRGDRHGYSGSLAELKGAIRNSLHYL
jgi:hypothetical protein